MTVALGCDHAGFSHKTPVVRYLKKAGYTIIDCGTNSSDSVDYPDFGHAVAQAVADGRAQYGVVLCGSGNGIAMSVNKHPELRCALCWKSELAALARAHNNANALAIPARFVSKRLAVEMVTAFLATEFEGGRHAKRVDKIACM